MASYYFRDEEKAKEKERAKHRAENKLYYRRLAVNKENSKQKWSIHDINLVLAHEVPDRVLSEQLGRSVKAIQEIRRVYKNRPVKEPENEDNS